MKLSPLFALIVGCVTFSAASFAATSPAPATADHPIRVAIYTDGGSPKLSGDYIETLLKGHDNFTFRRVDAKDIRGGVLKDIDVLVQPGGSGSGQAKALEQDGCDKIKSFVKNGGGYLGICGGAYLASADYPWSLHILNAKVIDRAHWNRGKATLTLDITPAGKQMLDLPTDKVQCLYHQGPLMAPGKDKDLPAYQPLATFETEVAENGAPKGVMIGTTAMARSVFGEGRVVAISPHPEQTAGVEGCVREAIEWVHGKGNTPSTTPLADSPTTQPVKQSANAAN